VFTLLVGIENDRNFMRTEQKFELFSKLKEAFLDATELNDYGNFTLNFEIDEDYSDDEQLYVDVEIQWRENKKIYVRLRIDLSEKKEVHQYEDVWEIWESFNFTMRNLWQKLFFEAIE